jgi:hypothetical protein
MNLQELDLITLLRRCIQDETDSPAWTELVARLDVVIVSCISATLAHARRTRINEIEDLKQLVWSKMVAGDGHVLKQFRREHAQSLRAYVAKITVTVVKNHLKTPISRERFLTSYSPDHIPEKWQHSANLVSRNDLNIETALLVRECAAIVHDSSEKEVRDRNVMIWELWLSGLSPLEISQRPGITISRQAIGKIIAKQKDRMRKISGRQGGPVPGTPQRR